MNKSYRNTVEIASYANHLAGITDMELFERHGEPVEECTFEGKDSFEEALGKLKNFVEQNGHWPFSASGEYECSLRRWQHEISHDIIPITHSQHQAYEELMTAFADKPKTRYQFEKKN